MTSTNRKAAAALAGLLLAPALATPALAHVTANPDEASSRYFRTALRVGHGCDGSPTTAVRVQIPEGVENAGAEQIAGWDAEVIREDLPEPIEGAHGPITDRVSEVVFSGNSLPDDQFQEFGLSLTLADDAPEVLWLPVIQECEEGANRWIEIPDSIDQWGELDAPAPYVTVAMDSSGSDADVDTTAADGGDDSNVLPVSALFVAVLALGAAGFALVRSGRR
ncbi:YcnI family protein [Hoyosella sp. G463]|uniref:YcnI family protein n=1 Tax=Lolliginicoccus lacisalsi TaxID=2742202 RepID=A0A927JAK7_9ACTN|nr:YcnI family protein [Lolliginicoccus lacisalsi]MBD8505751.1 YcnI family protein [Lolliginicoccus lacisalsi]